MSQGTLYIHPRSPRSTWLNQLTEDLKLNITIKDISASEFKELFPLGKTPAFIDESGFKLTETPFVFLYLISLADNSKLAGSNEKEKANVGQWLNFYNQDVIEAFVAYMQSQDDESKEKALKKIAYYYEYIDNTLSTKKWLVGNEITIADIYLQKCFKSSVAYLGSLDKYKNVLRWINDGDEEKPIYKS